MNYDIQLSQLRDAFWFAEHDLLDVAISLVDESFDTFNEFRAWWLTEGNPEYRLFDTHFASWVAKIMVLFYANHCLTDDDRMMVALTYSEIYKD